MKIHEAAEVNGEPTSVQQWPASSTWRLPAWHEVNGRTTTYTNDGKGNVWTITDPNRHVTELDYNWGVVNYERRPDSAVEVLRQINVDGTVQSETVGGLTTTFTYDDLGRIRTVQGPGGVTPITTTYDNVHGSSVTTQRGTVTTTTSLDGFGRPVETMHSSGVRVRTAYDAEGRVTYQGFPYTPGATTGNVDIGTTYTYDVLGRVRLETQPDGTSTERTYGLAAGSSTTTPKPRG